MEKHTREDFLYLDPQPPVDLHAQCGSCMMFTGKMNINGDAKKDEVATCTILGSVPIRRLGSCNLYVHGDPVPNERGKETAYTTKEAAGYVERIVRCENCYHFNASESECMLYEELNEESPDLFDLDEYVDPKGCCNLQKPNEETEPTISEGSEIEGGSASAKTTVFGGSLEENVKKVLKIYLVRHGMTDMNAKGLLRGWSNPPLSDEGKKQGACVSKWMQDKPLAAIYTSDLQRTYNMIATLKDKPMPKKMFDFRPMHLGALEGQPCDTIEPILKQLLDTWATQPDVRYDANSESFREFFNRVITKFKEVIDSHKMGEEILIVTHLRDCILLLAWILDNGGQDMDIKNFKPDLMSNITVGEASISVVVYDGNQVQVLESNETDHLTEAA